MDAKHGLLCYVNWLSVCPVLGIGGWLAAAAWWGGMPVLYKWNTGTRFHWSQFFQESDRSRLGQKHDVFNWVLVDGHKQFNMIKLHLIAALIVLNNWCGVAAARRRGLFYFGYGSGQNASQRKFIIVDPCWTGFKWPGLVFRGNSPGFNRFGGVLKKKVILIGIRTGKVGTSRKFDF